MAYHSRSSSEIEGVQYREVLPVFIEQFIKDFEFADVMHRLQTMEVFRPIDFKAISEEKQQKNQILRLFWLLCRSELTIERFLDGIKYEYKWLVEAIKKERNAPSKTTEQYIDALKMLRSKDQKHTDLNVHRMDCYVPLRNALKRLKPNYFVVLQGELGTGKKWLAQDVCCDFAVFKAMDFKIYFIDVHMCESPETDLRMLQQFRILLGETCGVSLSPAVSTGNISQHQRQNIDYFDSIANRILEIQQSIRKKLRTPEFKNCLLVLQNVKNNKTWQAFNLGCKMLIITRTKHVGSSISREMSEQLTIESGLTNAEFYELFEKCTGCKRSEIPLVIKERSKGHPYLLSIIAQSIKTKRNKWEDWTSNLLKLKISDNKFNHVIGMSLNVLRTELLELYATFAIFPHSIAIPIELLAALWSRPLSEAEHIVNEFHKQSLVDENVEKKTCLLPLIYSSYLQSSATVRSQIDQRQLHRKVIEYYNIDDTLANRTEVNCFNNHNEYFFHCIGYHLHALAISEPSEYSELFAKLYLDFGFLEQKLRTIDLLNVLTDLKYYEEEIVGNEPRRRLILQELREFLPKVEEKLIHSRDTCLLQYALMASDSVYEQAVQQVKQFPKQLWFSEKGNFHQRRQIVNLPKTPKIVHILEHDMCLIVLENNKMLLTDISLDCHNSILSFEDAGSNIRSAQILEARLIRDDNYILTLESNGQLKLWSIRDERRRSVLHKRSSKQKVHPLNINLNGKQDVRKCKQSIHKMQVALRGKIVAFDVEQQPPKYKNETRLHVAFDNGEICVLKFNENCEEFQYEKVPMLQTRTRNIRIICKLLTNYYMLLNDKGDLTFWNLRDSSEVYKSFEWPKQRAPFIKYEVISSEERQHTCIIFVFGNKVLGLEFKNQSLLLPNGRVSVLYETSDYQNTITCAKIAPDGRYLILGTSYGLVVIDMNTNTEILRSNVSEVITCVDIHTIDDHVFKYIITCGVKNKPILYLFSLRKTANDSIGWAHNVSHLSNEASNDPQLEPGVWLLGRKLYDIAYGEYTHLVAADSKNRIHQVCTTNSKNWSIVTPAETSHQINAVTTYCSNSFIGYKNGAIFNLSREIFEPQFTTDPITYLQLMDERLLVASSASFEKPKTRISIITNNKQSDLILNVDTKYCFKLYDKYLLLVNESGIITVLNAADEISIVYTNDKCCFEELGGCDFKNTLLFMATKCFTIHIYCIEDLLCEGNLMIQPLPLFEKNATITEDGKITCLCASNDASLVAVGLNGGNIEVYKILERCKLEFVYTLQSHSTQIYDLKFSPNAEVLVSCGEQLCFWSMNFIINNASLTNSPKRRSSRFSSQTSYNTDGIEEVDARVVQSGQANRMYLQVFGNNSVPTALNHGIQYASLEQEEADLFELCRMEWQDKRGPADKPELLACIKFDGNRAEKIFANKQFTQFNTIDDEGVYYHLQLYKQHEQQPTDEISNGHTIAHYAQNGHTSDANGNGIDYTAAIVANIENENHNDDGDDDVGADVADDNGNDVIDTQFITTKTLGAATSILT